MTLTPLEQALNLANMGLYVVAGYPVGEYERAIIKGTQDGTKDPEQLRKWFTEIQERNIYINLKNSGLICLDLDRHHKGQDGMRMLAELKNRYSDGQQLPVTYGEYTPKNGLHLFYRVPAELFDSRKPNNGIMGELADGVEVKTGFIPVYPSKRSDGAYMACYANEDGEPLSFADVADCPPWLLDLLPYKERYKPFGEQYSANNGQPTYGGQMMMLLANGTAEGGRNIAMNKFLYHLVHKMRVPPRECAILINDLNKRFSPPLDRKQVDNIWKSVFRLGRVNNGK
ncbi:TPA: bifunctional DNA primase/polymerase [Bacillus cereus]|nr:bifunctional DNA primase/polymerase [Bacillus cereus]